MRKIVGVLFSLLLIFAFICLRNLNHPSADEVLKKLHTADSLMFISPDSSLSILNNIKGIDRKSVETNAYYALLLSQARSRNYIFAENDSLINVALNFYETSNDSIKKAWTYLYASDVNDDLGENRKALTYVQKAAISAEGSNDNRLLCYIYYFWGRLLQLEKPYKESLDKLMESEKYARLLNDTSLLISRIKEVGWECTFVEDYKKAYSCYYSAISLAEKKQEFKELPILYHKLSYTFYKNGEYAYALKNIKNAIRYIGLTKDSLQIYNLMGDIYLKMNHLDSAYYYINKGKRDKNFYTKAMYQERMSELEATRGDYHKAYEYKKMYANYLDSIKEYEENNSVMALQKRYDYTQIKAENDRLEIESQQRNIWLLIVVIALMLVIMGSYLIFMYLKKKNQEELRLKEQLLARSVEEMQKKTNELILSKKMHQESETQMLGNLMDKQKELLQIESREKGACKLYF